MDLRQGRWKTQDSLNCIAFVGIVSRLADVKIGRKDYEPARI